MDQTARERMTRLTVIFAISPIQVVCLQEQDR